jgi:hypothetical protein
MPKNLWGDLGSLAIVRTPKTVLEEQAALLTEATKGLLVGRVLDETQGESFHYDLAVIVPALNNYKYTILSVIHSLKIYPVRIRAQRPPVTTGHLSLDAFEKGIERVLTSSAVRSALSHLRSQVT